LRTFYLLIYRGTASAADDSCGMVADKSGHVRHVCHFMIL